MFCVRSPSPSPVDSLPTSSRKSMDTKKEQPIKVALSL